MNETHRSGRTGKALHRSGEFLQESQTHFSELIVFMPEFMCVIIALFDQYIKMSCI